MYISSMKGAPNIKVLLAISLILSSIIACSSAASARCMPATSQQLTAIRPGLESGLDLASTAQSVKSSEFDNVYMVAAKITGPGMTDDAIGVWAVSGNPESPSGLVLSVNGIANEFSSWVD